MKCEDLDLSLAWEDLDFSLAWEDLDLDQMLEEIEKPGSWMNDSLDLIDC